MRAEHKHWQKPVYVACSSETTAAADTPCLIDPQTPPPRVMKCGCLQIVWEQKQQNCLTAQRSYLGISDTSPNWLRVVSKLGARPSGSAHALHRSASEKHHKAKTGEEMRRCHTHLSCLLLHFCYSIPGSLRVNLRMRGCDNIVGVIQQSRQGQS